MYFIALVIFGFSGQESSGEYDLGYLCPFWGFQVHGVDGYFGITDFPFLPIDSWIKFLQPWEAKKCAVFG